MIFIIRILIRSVLSVPLWQCGEEIRNKRAWPKFFHFLINLNISKQKTVYSYNFMMTLLYIDTEKMWINVWRPMRSPRRHDRSLDDNWCMHMSQSNVWAHDVGQWKIEYSNSSHYASTLFRLITSNNQLIDSDWSVVLFDQPEPEPNNFKALTPFNNEFYDDERKLSWKCRSVVG